MDGSKDGSGTFRGWKLHRMERNFRMHPRVELERQRSTVDAPQTFENVVCTGARILVDFSRMALDNPWIFSKMQC